MMARALVAVVLAACSRREAEPAAAPAAGPAVTLERTPCFGTCPVYTVAISRSGEVTFDGKRHVAQAGQATAKIPPERVDSLLAELAAAGYFELADAYVMDAPACGMYATDLPTVITSAVRDGETKTIRHDRGCSAAPQELSKLEQRIDEVAGTGSWGCNSHTPFIPTYAWYPADAGKIPRFARDDRCSTYRRNAGSSRSRTASPSIVAPTTTSTSATPGAAATHGALTSVSLPAASR